jgi:hypothetical protein
VTEVFILNFLICNLVFEAWKQEGGEACKRDRPMMPAASSAAMKEKILQAQDARRQRLRTRLHEISARGTPAPRSPTRRERSPGRERRNESAGTGRDSGGDGLRGKDAALRHVHFPAHGDGPAMAGEQVPAQPDAATHDGGTRGGIALYAEGGGGPWGLSLRIPSTPSPSLWPDPVSNLLGPDSPRMEAARREWRERGLNDPAEYRRMSTRPDGGDLPQPPTPAVDSTPASAQPLQRAHVDSVVQQMARPRPAPGERKQSGEEEARETSPPRLDSAGEMTSWRPGGRGDISTWTSFHEYRGDRRSGGMLEAPAPSSPAAPAHASAQGAAPNTEALSQRVPVGSAGEETGEVAREGVGGGEGLAWLRVVQRHLSPRLAFLKSPLYIVAWQNKYIRALTVENLLSLPGCAWCNDVCRPAWPPSVRPRLRWPMVTSVHCK